MNNWDLNKLYSSYESKEFQDDLLKVDNLINKFNEFKSHLSEKKEANVLLTDFLLLTSELTTLIEKLFSFISLNSATNTTDQDSAKYNVVLSQKLTELTEVETMFSKFVSKIEDLDELIQSSDFLKEHDFYLKEIVQRDKYNLDEKTEALLSKLEQSSSSLWGRLQGVLTSTLEVEYNGEILTLPEVIGKSEDKDPKVRKNAYEAELKAYEKVDKAIAFAMGGVKGEVNTLTEVRGYKSALDKAPVDSRMSEASLNAMIDSMKEYLPVFRKYLKRKGELLGHTNGLPWYDLYALTGKMSVEDVAKLANIDIINQDFWRTSLEVIKEDIELFIEITK